MLKAQTGMSSAQLRNFLTNYRKRHWKPVLHGRAPRSQLELVVQAAAARKLAAAAPAGDDDYDDYDGSGGGGDGGEEYGDTGV